MPSLRGPACACVALAAIFSAPVSAAEPALESARDCGRIEDGAERLACYDRLFRGRPGDAAPPVVREAEFGLTEIERREREREAGVTLVPDEIASTVARVSVRRPNPPVLELANGQTWRLLETSDSPPFRAGDHVTIRRGAIGSYLASARERPGAWRVRRVE
jgi:hypothetical protein